MSQHQSSVPKIYPNSPPSAAEISAALAQSNAATASIYLTGNQSTANGALHPITWTGGNFATSNPDIFKLADVNDYNALNNGVTNNGIALKQPGVYMITVQAQFAANATGQREISINGTYAASNQDAAASGVTSMSTTTVYNFESIANGNLEVLALVQQSSGGPLDIIGGIITTRMSIVKIL